MMFGIAVQMHVSGIQANRWCPTFGTVQSQRASRQSSAPLNLQAYPIPSICVSRWLQATDASDRGKGAEAALSAALPELLDAVSLSMPCREMCEVRLLLGPVGLRLLSAEETCPLGAAVRSRQTVHADIVHHLLIVAGSRVADCQQLSVLQGLPCQECRGVAPSRPDLLCFVPRSP